MNEENRTLETNSSIKLSGFMQGMEDVSTEANANVELRRHGDFASLKIKFSTIEEKDGPNFRSLISHQVRKGLVPWSTEKVDIHDRYMIFNFKEEQLVALHAFIGSILQPIDTY